MPLPVEGCAADISDDVCCDTLWLIGERIRTVAFNAVCACIEPDCRDQEMRSYSTEGDIVDLVGDSVICSFVGVGARADTHSRRGRFGPLGIHTAEYRIELRETNWPLAATLHSATQTIIRADDEVVSKLAKHARAHAEKMWRAVADAAGTTIMSRRLFNPTTHPFIINRGVAVSGAMRPIAGLSSMVGYRMTVTVDTTLP